MPMKKIKIAVTFIFIFVLLNFFLVPLKTRFIGKRAFQLRVCLEHNIDAFELYSESRCDVYDLDSSGLLYKKFRFNDPVEVIPEKNNVKLGNKVFDSGTIRISPIGKKIITVNGADYRGELIVINTREGLDVINVVDMEDYLKGVLPCEMNRFWPFAALKSQAIASRSFAAAMARRKKGETFDLTDDIFSQVYGGKDSERLRTSRAVQATKNKVALAGVEFKSEKIMASRSF